MVLDLAHDVYHGLDLRADKGVIDWVLSCTGYTNAKVIYRDRWGRALMLFARPIRLYH